MRSVSRDPVRAVLASCLLLTSLCPALAADEAASAEDDQRGVVLTISDLPIPPSDIDEGESAAAPDCLCLNTSDQARLWGRAEYLLWWTKGTYLPALLTTSPDGTNRDLAGVVGEGGTQLLFGDGWADNLLRSGARFRLGYEFSECPGYGLEAELLGLGAAANGDYVSPFSTGSPILARPLINANTGQEDAQLVAFPELADGRLQVRTVSDLYSASGLLRKNWVGGARARWDLLGGYRYFRYREDLNIEENLIARDPGGLVQEGTRIDVVDRFRTTNDFHGGEIGLEGMFQRGPWSLELTGRLAVGNVHQVVDVTGKTRVATPGDPAVQRIGGLLALPSNSGSRSDDSFAVLPQLNASLQYRLGDHLSLVGGYTWLLLSSVARAGEQIDRTIDPSQLSPLLGVGGKPALATRPQAFFQQTAFWAHGVNLGLQLSY